MVTSLELLITLYFLVLSIFLHVPISQQLSREKKIAILTAVQGDFKLCIAEYKGTLPPTYKHEWRFRRFYYLKLCKPAKTQVSLRRWMNIQLFPYSVDIYVDNDII